MSNKKRRKNKKKMCRKKSEEEKKKSRRRERKKTGRGMEKSSARKRLVPCAQNPSYVPWPIQAKPS